MTSSLTLRRGDRVLVTRLDYLGDVVLSLPLVDALLAQYPGIEVDYLTRRPGAELLAGDARFGRVLSLGKGLLAGARMVRTLRRRRYRLVIDLYSNPRSAWLSWLSGAPVRVGGERRGRRRLYTHPVRVARTVRAVTDVFLAYGAAVGVSSRNLARPTLAVSAKEREAAERILAAAGAGAGRVRVGVHPGGKWPVKRWPAEKFVALVELVRARAGAEVVLFTGPGEHAATEAVRERCAGSRVLPELDTRTAAATVAQLDAMVACDGGIMHVAVAVGTPTVGIFGSSEWDVWFPYESLGPFRAARVAVPCRPCHKHVCPLGTTACLNDLSAEAVWGEVERVLALSARTRSRST